MEAPPVQVLVSWVPRENADRPQTRGDRDSQYGGADDREEKGKRRRKRRGHPEGERRWRERTGSAIQNTKLQKYTRGVPIEYRTPVPCVPFHRASMAFILYEQLGVNEGQGGGKAER